MTMTERSNGAQPTDLTDEEERELARQAWIDSGGRLTGKELAAMFPGRPAKWGQRRAIEAKARSEGRVSDATAATSGPSAAVTPLRPAADTTAASPKVTAPRRPDRPRTPPGRRPRTAAQATPLPLLAATVVAVAVVTAVCAVVSYMHIQHLAASAGMGSLSWWVPLGIDGLVVACSCSLIVDRRNGHPGHPLAFAGVALGLAGSLAANVLAVDPTLVSIRVVRWVLAGYSPAALAVSAHMALRMLDQR